MEIENRTIAGSLLFLGGLVCILGIITAEAFYPDYSTSENYISDLGVGPSSLIFNSAVFLMGLLVICGAYFIQRKDGFRLFSILTVITGIGSIGVALFTEDAGVLHLIFSFITFLFAGLSAIVSYRIQKQPFGYFSIILGILSLLAMGMFGSGNYLGLGKGGMERMIAYPLLIWVVGFGGYLLGLSQETM